MTPQERFVAMMRAWVGYHEKASNAYLTDFKKNNGGNNWTIFAKILDQVKFYNTLKNGFEWCDIFFDACMFFCFGLDLMQKMTGQTKGVYNEGAGVGASASYYKKMGRWFTYPEPGDQTFFKKNGVLVHTGGVVEVKDGKVYVSEGNTSDGTDFCAAGYTVAIKRYDLNDPKIAGYGRPKWELAENAPKFGVDISEAQKGIPFDKMKLQGVRWALIRAGEGKNYDIAYEEHCAKAASVNMPFGVYWATHALTVEAAQEEARKTVKAMQGKNVTLPVWIDVEVKALLNLSRRQLTDVVIAWAQVIKDAGYTPGIYTTMEWLQNRMYLDELSGLKRWIALWGSKTPSMPCDIWQYGATNDHRLQHFDIPNYNVDCNYMYTDFLEEDETMYHTLKDVPAYYRKEVDELIANGALNGKGGEGEDLILDYNEGDIRTMVVMHRDIQKMLKGITAQTVDTTAIAKEVAKKIGEMLVQVTVK